MGRSRNLPPSVLKLVHEQHPGLFAGSATNSPAAKPRLKQDRNGPNKLEAAWHEELIVRGYINIQAQGIGIRIANGCVYWPDFVAEHPETSHLCAFETKGFMRDDAAVKIKVAARTWKSIDFYLVTRAKKRDGGGWTVEKVLS